MTAENSPTWMARRRGPRLVRVEFNPNGRAERDAPTAERASARPTHVRQIRVGEQTLYAVSAHELLQQLSDADQARPGHPLG